MARGVDPCSVVRSEVCVPMSGMGWIDTYVVCCEIFRLSRRAGCVWPLVGDRDDPKGKPLSIAVIESIGEGGCQRCHSGVELLESSD